MKKAFVVAMMLMLCMSAVSAADISDIQYAMHPNQEAEARKAFDLINNARRNPSQYTSQTGVDLSGIKSRAPLAWNNQLAQAAQKKAQDMATRNYFGQTDPDGHGINYYINQAGYSLNADYLAKNDANYFGCITATFKDGAEAAKYLIKDGNASNQQAGNRRLLLGIDDFYSDCTDIGVAVYYNPNSTYKYYWCIIVAKHGQADNKPNNKPNDNKPNDNTSSELKLAASYLNQIRQNPAAYSNEIGISLAGITARPQLNWNNQLAAAAQKKAQDMADRGYLGHVDPDGYGMNYFINQAGYTLIPDFLRSKSANNFESICGGTKTAKETIKCLLYDMGANNSSAGHRIHLLGIDNFWANCTDIGVGMGYNPNSPYKYYWCVLVAKHNF